MKRMLNISLILIPQHSESYIVLYVSYRPWPDRDGCRLWLSELNPRVQKLIRCRRKMNLGAVDYV